MAPVRPNPTLSDDLMSEILKRVPVKSLLCFKSVCKTWLSLIKHPAFVKSQLLHAITTEADKTIIEHEKFSLLDVDSCQIVAQLKSPYPRGECESAFYSKIVGSANGIVCVALNFGHFGCWRTDIYFWNPAIRQSKRVASLFDTSVNMYLAITVGFGYDVVGDDFKVVTLVLNDRATYYEVYSNNRNAWRNVPNSIDNSRNGPFHVCINGFLCGMGCNGMMTFDLNREVMNYSINLPVIDDAHDQELLNRAIEIPGIYDAHAHAHAHAHDNDNDDETRIIEFNNSVAVLMLMGLDKCIDMWTLDDDACLQGGGVEASWTPMFSIYLGTPTSLKHGYFSNGNILSVLVTNDVKMWILCDADKKEAKIVPLSVEMDGNHYIGGLYKYTESLVSLEGFKQFNWDDGEDDN